jgi:hypothetical protein
LKEFKKEGKEKRLEELLEGGVEKYEGEEKRLKEKEKLLEAEKKKWGDQVVFLQQELTKFNKEGNEQIA